MADKSKVLAHEAVGAADIGAAVRMPLDAMFWIASPSKPITGTALMLLIDEGKVSPDDPVEKYLPEFKGQMFVAEKDAEHVLLKRPPHPITVKNVLTHTSGLPFRSPTEQQMARIAKAYKPGPDNRGLVEVPIDQLHRPYTDRSVRQPMPAGGLFSTAQDLTRFYQMILNRGELDGKRFLSEASVAQLTSRQTPPELKDSYGFGFAVGGNTVGHGGAYSTNTQIDTKNGLIFVWLVQHAGFPGEGGKSQDAFRRAALEKFAR